MHLLPDWTAAYPGDLVAHLRSLGAIDAALGRSGTFMEAARRLGVDESVLRRRVQTLEAAVGFPLLEGRGGRMRWTDAGARVRDTAVSVLHQLSAMASGVRPPPRLRIGCTGTIANELLPPAVASVQHVYPDLLLHVARAGASEGLQGVEDGSLDIAVVRSSAPPRGVEHRFLSPDQLHLATPKDHPLAVGRLGLAAMARYPVVTFRPSSSTRARVMSVLAPLGATARIEVEGKSTALRYVQLGLGIAFLSVLPHYAPKAKGVVVRDVSRFFAATSFWAIWRKGRAQPEWEKRVVEGLAHDRRDGHR